MPRVAGAPPDRITFDRRMRWARRHELESLTGIALTMVRDRLGVAATVEFVGRHRARWTVAVEQGREGRVVRDEVLAALDEAEREWHELP